MSMKNIQLKIVLPHKVLPSEEVGQIVIPAEKGMMTIIPDRAPTTVLLKNGIVDVLNAQGVSQKKYFIQSGVANIAADKCMIITEKALNLSELKTEDIQNMKTEYMEEMEEIKKSFSSQNQIDTGIEFYDEVLNYLKYNQ